MSELSIRIKGSDSDMLKALLDMTSKLYIKHYETNALAELAQIYKNANMEIEELKIDGKTIQ